MDLIPNSEQNHIIESTARFIADQLPVTRLQDEDKEAVKVTASTWAQMAELGWFGLGLEEELGGVGYTLAEEVLLLRELGRQLGPLAVLATIIAARVAALAGNEMIVRELLSGEARVGIANGLQPLDRGQIDRGQADSDKISGSCQLLDSDDAKYVISLNEDSVALIETDLITDKAEQSCLDPGTGLSQADLRGVPVAVRLNGDLARTVYRRALILTAAMQTGQAMACQEMAVEYSKTRVQFDKPIGAFQSIKHRCSNMTVRSEAADSLTIYAAVAAIGQKSDAKVAAASAHYIASDAARVNATDNIQIHGGIGFTQEYVPHLYVKRSHVLDLLFVSPAAARRQVLNW